MANFPNSLDNISNLPDNTVDTSPLSNPDHATLHNNISDAIIATETKLGTGASIASTDTILIGTGSGTSEWATTAPSGSVNLVTSVTGVLPIANGGTGSTTGGFVSIAGDLGGTTSDPEVISTHLTAPLPIVQGGTGETTQASAITALTGTQTAGYFLRSNGTSAFLDGIQVSDVPILNQNTTGTAENVTGVVAISNGGTGTTTATGTGETVLATSPSLITPDIGTPSRGIATNLTGLPLTTGVTGVLPIANGGTGSTTGGFVDIAGDIGGTTTDPQIISTHLLNPLSYSQGGNSNTHGGDVYNVNSYNALGDGLTRSDGDMTVGSSTLTSASGTFTSTDAGKLITIANAAATCSLPTSLISGNTYTSFAVTPVTTSIASGSSIVLGYGQTTQTVVTSAAVVVGSTTINVTSFVSNADYGVGTPINATTLITTITSVQSATSITLSVNAEATVSGQVYYYGTDNASLIQGAINAANSANGGIVLVPEGLYLFSTTLNIYPNVSLEGQGKTTSIIQLTSLTADAIYYNNTSATDFNISIVSLGITGPVLGSGDGIHLNGAPLVGVSIQECYIQNFGGNGVYLGGCITSSIINSTSYLNGGHGFFIDGSTSFVTSTSAIGSYALNNSMAGWYWNNSTYCSASGCASDSNGIGWLLLDCNAWNASGCGAESSQSHGITGYPGVAWKITSDSNGSVGVGLNSCYAYNTYDIGFWITGTSTNVTLNGCVAAVPHSGYIYSLEEDSGTQTTEISCYFSGTVIRSGTSSQLAYGDLTANNNGTFGGLLTSAGLTSSSTIEATGGGAIKSLAADGTNSIEMYHTGSYGLIQSSTGFVLANGGAHNAAVTGTNNPQFVVQYAGGNYNSINFYNDDSNGTISTTAGNIILDPSSGITSIIGKLDITTGTNAAIGTAVLVGGTVTVDTTAVTASSIIMLTRQVTGGTVGELSVGTITAGTSFVINSASSTDTSTVGYLIIN